MNTSHCSCKGDSPFFLTLYIDVIECLTSTVPYCCIFDLVSRQLDLHGSFRKLFLYPLSVTIIAASLKSKMYKKSPRPLYHGIV